jgi:hypothetical protein
MTEGYNNDLSWRGTPARRNLWPTSNTSLLTQWREQMYNDQFSRMEALFKELAFKIDRIDKRMDDTDRKLQELLEDDYYDPEPQPSTQRKRNEQETERFIEEEEIYRLGQKIPYSRITDPNDMDAFRDFIAYIRMHEDKFTTQEVDYAGFADKNFSDIRLADKTRRILGQAYMKMHRKQWPFKLERGHMHKYLGQIAWSWADGTKD